MTITDRVNVDGKMITEVCSHSENIPVVQNSHDANIEPDMHI